MVSAMDQRHYLVSRPGFIWQTQMHLIMLRIHNSVARIEYSSLICNEIGGARAVNWNLGWGPCFPTLFCCTARSAGATTRGEWLINSSDAVPTESFRFSLIPDSYKVFEEAAMNGQHDFYQNCHFCWWKIVQPGFLLSCIDPLNSFSFIGTSFLQRTYNGPWSRFRRRNVDKKCNAAVRCVKNNSC